MTFASMPTRSRWHTVGKRSFDIVVAAGGLVVLLPLLVLLALVVKADSAGPVLFRQPRVGQHGRVFHIVKFRSMHADAGAQGPALTIGADARITRAGAWMRVRHVDELPQLWNVLVGSMSMVGPRPEVPHFAQQVAQPLRSRWLALKPGITDPASLAHADEATLLGRAADAETTYLRSVLPAKVQASVAYGESATLRSDAGVLWRSIVLVMVGRQ